MNPPVAFAQQAHAIFWEEFSDWQIYTPFTKRLAQLYIAEYAAIPENPYRNRMDAYLDFKGFDVIVHPLERQLAWVLSATGGSVEGKRILDLGCGSTGDTNRCGRIWTYV